jgi:DNA-binding NtrC family response regulator
MVRPQLSILAVTSSLEKADAMVSMLALRRGTVRHVSSCSEAIAYLDEYPTQLVVCDGKLPDGSWFTLLEAIQKMEDAPLLIASANCDDPAQWVAVHHLGDFEMVLKRFDSKEIQCTVAAALRFTHQAQPEIV